MRRIDVRARDRPAGALASQPVDVVGHLELIGGRLDLVTLVAPHLVVERDDEREVALAAVARVVRLDVEVAAVVGDPTFDVPAFARTVFLLDRRDTNGDGATRSFELELDCPTGVFVPIEEREHQVELAGATGDVERQLVLSHTTLL